MGDLTESVAAWLTKSGFPLELRVAAEWQRAGFDVTQSVYYIDPETSAARETDVIASRDNLTEDSWLRWFFVVECKSGRDAPWVMFPRRGPPLEPKYRILMLPASVRTRPYLARIARRSDVRALAAFQSDHSPAYGMVQALREKPDHAYTAMMSVAKAAAAILDDLSSNADIDEAFEIVSPVIITEAPLFEAQLSPNGDIEVQPIERGTLLWRHPIAGKGVATIDIIHADNAPSYIAQMKEASSLILYNTSQEASKALEVRQAKSQRGKGE